MSKYICDGHEYRVVDASDWSSDRFHIKNNYGSHVASIERSDCDEYWSVWVVGSQDLVAQWHENDIVDNLIEQTGVQAYVAWAMDNDTVEGH